MGNRLLVVCFIFLISFTGAGQTDTAANVPVSLTSASVKATNVIINLSDPDELEFALKKIHTFRNIESITLEGDAEEESLKKLFYRLSVLRNLSELALKDNELDKIPENISILKTLKGLTVEGNSNLDFNDLLASVKSLQLTRLNLIDNDLKVVPTGISNLTSLKFFQLSGSNQLDYSALFERLAKLPGLTTLSIPVNYITELPKNIEMLKSLQVLDVSNNNLTDLPGEISSLKTINNLSIQGNLLIDPAKSLEKLQGNNIQYLSLDKEISGEELEQIKKMFPTAQIDFPSNKDEQEQDKVQKEADNKKEPEPPHSGELSAKKEAVLLSGAYLLYPALFQGLIYSFDTLSFEERYRNTNYANIYQRVENRPWRAGTFHFRRWLYGGEKPGKKNETWFRLESRAPVSGNYPEFAAFGGMYWVYKGDLNKKQFAKKFLTRRQRPNDGTGKRRRKKKRPIEWNDIRIEFSKNNSLFTFTLKNDSAFCQFSAYPVVPGIPIERSQQTYNRRYLMYKKSLLRRTQRFNRDLKKNKYNYDLNYKRLRDYSWKELQLRMSREEKAMTQEEWLKYYDNIIANEQKAIDSSPLSETFILRNLVLKGYQVSGLTGSLTPVATQTVTPQKGYGYKTFNVEFEDTSGGGKLPVSTILVINNKDKTVSQFMGSMGLFPVPLTFRQYSDYSILVQLRNGNWGCVTPGQIDKLVFEPNKSYQLNTLVFDKNLDTIGTLMKNGIK